jgi:hypothetical protein
MSAGAFALEFPIFRGMKDLYLASAMIVAPLVLPAQQLTGEQQDTGSGFGFTIPDGWVGAASTDGYVLGHTTVPGMILIAPKPHADLATVQIGADSTVTVVQAGTVQGTPVKVMASARLNPFGGNTANLMAFASVHEFGPALENALRSVQASVRYSARSGPSKGTGPDAATGQVSDPGDDGIDMLWKERLSGTRLTYMESYNSPSSTEGVISGGYSVQERIDLCAEGHFKTGSRSEHTISGADVSGYSSGSDAGEGTWKALHTSDGSSVLRLGFNNGRVVDHRLEWQDGKTYLNGVRWYRTSLANDGPEYAPDCP